MTNSIVDILDFANVNSPQILTDIIATWLDNDQDFSTLSNEHKQKIFEIMINRCVNRTQTQILYTSSDSFTRDKKRIQKIINNCNELTFIDHIRHNIIYINSILSVVKIDFGKYAENCDDNSPK